MVYGQPAIALPLPSVTTQVVMRSADNGQTIASRYFDGPIAQMGQNLAGVAALITTLLDRFDGQATPFAMTITSDLPAERGMGSSAAVAVAITRAMYRFFQRLLNRELLLSTVDIAEKITHGNPSGIDAATVSSDVPIWFVPVKKRYRFPLPCVATSSSPTAASRVKRDRRWPRLLGARWPFPKRPRNRFNASASLATRPALP